MVLVVFTWNSPLIVLAKVSVAALLNHRLATRQACRCSAVSTDSIMAFVAVTDIDAPAEESRKAEERQFRGSHVPDLATLAGTGGAGVDGVCG